MRLIQVRWAATMVMNIADVHFFKITTDLSILNVENSLQHQLVHIVHCATVRRMLRTRCDTRATIATNHTPPTCGHNLQSVSTNHTPPNLRTQLLQSAGNRPLRPQCDACCGPGATHVRPMCDHHAAPTGAIFNFLTTGPCEIRLHLIVAKTNLV